jgi:hypothetical protein
MNKSYKDKYLKYKKKYLELKQKGGAKVFYLFVTGIAEYLQYDNFWCTTLKKTIIKKIPSYIFNSVKIIYYDPIRYGESVSENEVNKVNQILTVNETIDDKNVEGIFIKDFFPVDDFIPPSKNYLIIDCAHIFNYIDPKRPNIFIHNNNINKIHTLNVLYLGYLAEPQISNGFYNRGIINIDFLNIDRETVITWTDKLLNLGYNINSNYPIDIFTKPIQDFVKNKKKELYNKIPLSLPNRLEILNEIDKKFEDKEICMLFLDSIASNMFLKKNDNEEIMRILNNVFNLL